MWSLRLCFLGALITFARSSQGTGVCGSCVHVARCPPVLQILGSYPYSTQSYFFAAVTCGYVGYEPLVCCEMDVIQKALTVEAKATGFHRDAFEDIIDIYENDFLEPSLEDFQTENYYDGSVSNPDVQESVNERLQEDAASNASVYRVNDAVCGSNTKFRIIGGEEAATGMFPWMARLGYRVRGSVNGSAVTYRCGGALVTARHVLTAAHCLVRLPQSTYLAMVKLGTEGSPTQSFTPERSAAHAGYNQPRLQNDIGLVRLNRAAVFTDTIMPICLPFGEFAVDLSLLPPRAMLVAGWGSTSADSSSVSPTLQYTRLTYLSLAECSRVYEQRFNVTIGPNQICTIGESERDSCGGDSGGPMFVWAGAEGGAGVDGGGARAVGLVSFGARRCGTRGVPTVYTRLDAYRRWIEDAVAN